MPVTLGEAALGGFEQSAADQIRQNVLAFADAAVPGAKAALGEAVFAGRVESALAIGRAQGLSSEAALGWFTALLMRLSPHLPQSALMKEALALPAAERVAAFAALFESARMSEFGALPPPPGPTDDWASLRPGGT